MFHIESVNGPRDFCQDFSMYSENEAKEYHTSSPITVSPSATSTHDPNSVIQVKDYTSIREDLSDFLTFDVSYLPNNTTKNYYTHEKRYLDRHHYSDSQFTLRRNCGQHFCASKKHGVTKTITKRKRKRTMFTTEQIIALEKVFNRKPYIHREERRAMSYELQISEKSIKSWFQNRRRLTDRRSKDYVCDSPSSEDMLDNISDRLAAIETEINQNTDAHGYVRLDNKTMGELASVIDEYLSQDLSSVEEIIQPETNECKVIYEPISPVSLIEYSEDVEQREFASREANQFTDIKSFLFF